MAEAIAEKSSKQQVLLGDEAVALGAVHAGMTAAYAYPGTPSTEIVEYLLRYQAKHGAPLARWAANEKTAYEAALGTSMVGRRALVAMKHVGLNVAADPFVNSAVIAINGGLVVAVADDPGMHSSQNEQDTRYLADFAHTICLEPYDQQQAYEMTREAFELSERFEVPVVLRLVTRLAHSRAVVETASPRAQNPIKKPGDVSSWVLLPSIARRQWQKHLDLLPSIRAYMDDCVFNTLELGDNRELGVITTGLARNYYLECLPELADKPAHLHIGAYPIPSEKIRALAAHVKKIIVVEEGWPFVERQLRGVLDQPVAIEGKMSGQLPAAGELNTDIVRAALGLPVRAGVELGAKIPGRPPQLCKGCPHADTFSAINAAIASSKQALVSSDIGCYTLGALPPYNAIESCVCMGASVGVAKGAAEAGYGPTIGVIGDSTFMHSGLTPLVDAVTDNAPLTLIIVDNSTTAMTGGQPTILPGTRFEAILLAIGVEREHLHIIEAHRKKIPEMTELIRTEMAHQGPSVIIAVRECLETATKSKKEKR